MTVYLVFNTQADAEKAQKAIFDASLPYYREQGFTTDVNGIIGKVNGKSSREKSGTVRWDIPKQRLDSKWVIVAPEKHPSATAVRPGRKTLVDEFNTEIERVLGRKSLKEIDPRDGTWFALVDLGV